MRAARGDDRGAESEGGKASAVPGALPAKVGIARAGLGAS